MADPEDVDGGIGKGQSPDRSRGKRLAAEHMGCWRMEDARIKGAKGDRTGWEMGVRMGCLETEDRKDSGMGGNMDSESMHTGERPHSGTAGEKIILAVEVARVHQAPCSVLGHTRHTCRCPYRRGTARFRPVYPDQPILGCKRDGGRNHKTSFCTCVSFRGTASCRIAVGQAVWYFCTGDKRCADPSSVWVRKEQGTH